MDSLDELREVLTCVVCLDTLSPIVVQCYRGHALCQECRQDQQRCPSCRKPFLVDKPTLLCQIAAIVKGKCKFPGCTYIREKRNDDHHLWCGFVPADCKLCNWKGLGKDIFSHVQNAHHAALVCNGSDNLIQKLDHCIQSRQLYVPFSAFGFFFWLHVRVLNLDWNNHHNLIAFQVCFVPNGKIENNLQFTIDFKSDDCDYDVRKKIQLKMLPTEVPNFKNCIFIPAMIFYGERGTLKINTVKSGSETTDRNVNFYTKYNFNRIFDIFAVINRICDLYETLKNHIVEITDVEIILFLALVWLFVSGYLYCIPI